MKANKLAEQIRALGEQSMYQIQAETLLQSAGVLFEARQAIPQMSPRWAKDGEHGIQWSITLAKLKEKPQAEQYIGTVEQMKNHIEKKIQFFFWDSIANKEKTKKPQGYDVLANLYNQFGDTFEDFCANFGYSTDSREAEATYKEVEALNRKLESIFTAEELEALLEIN